MASQMYALFTSATPAVSTVHSFSSTPTLNPVFDAAKRPSNSGFTHAANATSLPPEEKALSVLLRYSSWASTNFAARFVSVLDPCSFRSPLASVRSQ